MFFITLKCGIKFIIN